jgi:putative tributyrin esterase
MGFWLIMTASCGRAFTRSHSAIVIFCLVLSLLTGCSEKKQESRGDNPRLSAGVSMRDVTFHSPALGRDMLYRAIVPAIIPTGKKLKAIYLLHGGGGGFRDWSNYSDVARFAERGLILIMPEGNSSYYTNSATRTEDRYEDYIVKDLISEVEGRFPVSAGREDRAIAGVSMGGYGAIKIALRHPELFEFAGGLSPALDVPSRPFSIKRLAQWRFHSSIFGPSGSQTRHDNDPFVLIRSADPARTPYLFVACGEQEGLLPANRQFAKLLEQRHFTFEFRTTAGGHDWNQWNKWVPSLFQAILDHTNQSK